MKISDTNKEGAVVCEAEADEDDLADVDGDILSFEHHKPPPAKQGRFKGSPSSLFCGKLQRKNRKLNPELFLNNSKVVRTNVPHYLFDPSALDLAMKKCQYENRISINLHIFALCVTGLKEDPFIHITNFESDLCVAALKKDFGVSDTFPFGNLVKRSDTEGGRRVSLTNDVCREIG